MGDEKVESNTYRAFIKEAFIDPIRTAVVVDDEYPTMSDLLALSGSTFGEGKAASLSPQKEGNIETVKKLIGFCRTQKPTPWLIDVHDGSKPPMELEAEMASHFDHSDLLILDYHLDNTLGSEKAIQILQKLAGNEHFNLVAVYTRSREGVGSGIEKTIQEIALSLTYPEANLILHPKALESFSNKLSDWGDTDLGVEEKLRNIIDDALLLRLLGHDKCAWSNFKDLPELSDLATLVKTIPATLSITADQVFLYAMTVSLERNKGKMAPKQFGRVAMGAKDGVNWIRTGSIFVTVISKEVDPLDIPDRLLRALEAWDPIPHRLIMAKMRSEISLRGGIAESDALRNRHLQAAWLEDILIGQEAQRRTNVQLDVARQWEGLGGRIRPGVLQFSDRLANYLVAQDRENLMVRFDRFNAREQPIEVHLQINSYVCSKPVEGHHLSTGHVYRSKQSKGTFFHWLCLSPACDLEPGQGAGTGWKKKLGTWMPVKAVRLFDADPEQALAEANRAYHIFVVIDGAVRAFGFADPSFEKESVPTLRWEQKFAKNEGVFDQEKVIEIATPVSNDALSFETLECRVVAQLRYEYAINLLQRLGAHLSRVGLDFRARPIPTVDDSLQKMAALAADEARIQLVGHPVQ